MTSQTQQKIATDLKGAAVLVDCGIDFVRDAIVAGDLPARRIGRKYSIRIDDLDEWQRNLPLA